MEFNRYFKQHFNTRHRIPAVFIDAYPDEFDENEIERNLLQVQVLQDHINFFDAFKLDNIQVFLLLFPISKDFTKCTTVEVVEACGKIMENMWNGCGICAKYWFDNGCGRTPIVVQST